MKKWMIVFLISAAGLTGSLYLFIPNNISIQKSAVIDISQQAIRRLLIENPHWNQGWLENDKIAAIKDSGRSVSFNGNTYSLVDSKYSSIILAIHRGNDTIATTSLNVVGISKGRIKLDWVALMVSPLNPVKRFKIYLQSKKLENDMGYLLNRIDSFYSKTTNVYGINIRQETVTDSTLLSVYDSSRGYPKTEFIYSLIGQLKNYISSQGANIKGYPMLNIFTRDSIVYLVKVALPVDKKLPTSGKMTYKWMLPRGNILVSEVTGGTKTIEHGFQQMEYFMKDYGRDAPAIPFVSLVTDRMQEKDSTKWITRINFPVME